MAKYFEPKLHGLTRKKRKEFFRSLYRPLVAGEIILETDQEHYTNKWGKPQKKSIGKVVPENHSGQFRRRTAPFKEL